MRSILKGFTTQVEANAFGKELPRPTLRSWHINREKSGHMRYVVATDTERVASVYTESNARLIAAVPDLLDLVCAFESYLEDNSQSERRRAHCLAEIKNVLDKAIG
jgi:hypothetical protein